MRWIVFAPLLGAAINGLLNRRLPRQLSGLIGCATVGVSLILSIRVVMQLAALPVEDRVMVDIVGRWLSFGDLHLDIGFLLDPLSAVMILVVTGVGFLIHVYSVGYMAHDDGFQRFFTYLNLFIFAMLTLVLGENLPLLFVGWEGVGLCSYLLISFWFDDDVNADAGRKAFITNRVGDFGALLAMFVIAAVLLPQLGEGEGVFSFLTLQHHAAALGGVATLASLLLFLGVTGKSAQIPLYIWLPDAMAGPTPVSALIHAATMVTAGVYLMARMNFLLVLSPVAMSVIAGVGIATAIFAATIALTQTDIKKVLAYSTVSQLGYMVAACGVGAFKAGIFHVMTHAFFKALLFLGAGSVIHAMHHEQDMRVMGGLRGKMPVTWWTMLVGTLAIAGVAPLSGFFSKDEILYEAYLGAHGGFPWVWLIGFLAAGLTAFYMMRLLVLTFFGENRASAEVQSHIHESPWTMTLPLVVLAVLSFGGGWIGIPEGMGGGAWFQEWLKPVFAGGHGAAHGAHGGHHDHTLELVLAAISFTMALIGLGLGYLVYARRPGLAETARNWLGGGLHRLLNNKYFVDELYGTVIYRPLRAVSDVVMFRWIDRGLIDGLLVSGSAVLTLFVGSLLRLFQNGMVRFYAWVFALGVTVFTVYLTVGG
ncbi:NADH-quinone oxidoreductase subunit L [bacterium]|nr:NADH-quinone oxidoreductase subunit L [bacterium]